MATPIDGPGIFSGNYTWGSKFGYVVLSSGRTGEGGPATTTENTMLFMGEYDAYVFFFGSGYRTSPDESFADASFIPAGDMNETYIPEFLGKTITPGAQGFPPSPPDSQGWSEIPAPPFPINSDLLGPTGFQEVSSPAPKQYYYSGITSMEGLVTHN